MEKGIRPTPFLIDNNNASCFICLEERPDSSLKQQSLMTISRYLRLDLEEVAPSSSDSRNGNVLVPLCSNCLNETSSFTKFYSSLEIIRIQLDSCLRKIHKLMVVANQNQLRRSSRSRGSPQSSSFSNCGSGRAVEKLRRQVIDKCTKKFRQSKPQLVIKRLEDQEIFDPFRTREDPENEFSGLINELIADKQPYQIQRIYDRLGSMQLGKKRTKSESFFKALTAKLIELKDTNAKESSKPSDSIDGHEGDEQEGKGVIVGEDEGTLDDTELGDSDSSIFENSSVGVGEVMDVDEEVVNEFDDSCHTKVGKEMDNIIPANDVSCNFEEPIIDEGIKMIKERRQNSTPMRFEDIHIESDGDDFDAKSRTSSVEVEFDEDSSSSPLVPSEELPAAQGEESEGGEYNTSSNPSPSKFLFNWQPSYSKTEAVICCKQERDNENGHSSEPIMQAQLGFN